MQRSKIRTVFDNLLQGATFNLADEATSAIASPIVSLMTGMAVPEAYAAGQELSRKQLEQDQAISPYTATLSNLAGGFVNPATYIGAGAAQRGGSAINNIMRATGIGAGQGAAYGFGAGNDTYDRLGKAAYGSLLGGAAGGVLQGGAEMIKNPAVQKFAKDYIADETGDLKIGNEAKKAVDDNTEYFIKKIKEIGGNVGDISKSKNRNGDFSNYIDVSMPNMRGMNVRISDHMSNDKYNTSSINLVNTTKEEIDNIISRLKSESAIYGEKIAKRKEAELAASIQEAARKKQAYAEQISGIERKITAAKEKGYGQKFDRIPEFEQQISKLKGLLKND